MKRTLLLTTTAMLIAASAVSANPQYPQERVLRTITEEAPKPEFENIPVKQNPMDYSNINQSPIRGRGRIKVMHNEPAPDDTDAEIAKARWLLQDNGYQCSVPRVSRR